MMITAPYGWVAIDGDVLSFLRTDGVGVEPGLAGGWLVRRTGVRRLMDACPCCGAQFRSARSAMRVADAIVPMNEEEGDDDATVGA